MTLLEAATLFLTQLTLVVVIGRLMGLHTRVEKLEKQTKNPDKNK